jgi:uncharacterized protein (DUF362 family)
MKSPPKQEEDIVHKKDFCKTLHARSLSRRDFLKAAAVTGAAGLLAQCAPAAGISRTATLRQPEILRSFAGGKSKVVRTRLTGVWRSWPKGVPEDNALLDSDALRKMLDSSIVAFTGLDSARAAWAAIFSPDEWIAIKVNTIQGSQLWTHPALVNVVAQSLQEIGVPTEHIIIYDRTDADLRSAGFAIKRDGPDARCYGTEGGYSSGWQIAGKGIRLSNLLLQCDALINMPVYKAHGISGFTFAMKNHYGTLDRPEDFHQGVVGRAIADLNALPAIQDRTRLIIGDVLSACTMPRESDPYWRLDTVGHSILMGCDPVAFDTVAVGMIGQLSNAPYPYAARMASEWLQNARNLGIGTNNPGEIELIEQVLA